MGTTAGTWVFEGRNRTTGSTKPKVTGDALIVFCFFCLLLVCLGGFVRKWKKN